MNVLGSIKKLLKPNKGLVLMYHRIAEPAVDPWRLSVTKEHFEHHLQILTTSFNVIRVSELVQNMANRKFEKDTISITFDDGYQDNFLHALPLLEKYNCPATFFIASGHIGTSEGYWWDTLSNIFLIAEQLPDTLDITINNKNFHYSFNNNGKLTGHDKASHSSWFWPTEPPTQRAEAYLAIWMELRNLPYILIKQAVNELQEWSGVHPENEGGSFPMSRLELLSLSEHPVAETGIHTVTHAALGAFPKDIQVSEIAGCKDFLDRNLNKRHTTIAYPYGYYNTDTAAAVKQAGLKAAFTTDAVPVTARSDVYRIGRYQVVNQNGDQFSCMLKKLLYN
jgi:peptidoglycan/xylan/chitin deacetylase (PgdA/CDA1 family)